MIKTILCCILLLLSKQMLGSSFTNEEALIEHVKHSIALAEKGISKLSPKVLKIDGMSTPKVRHFLNNLCEIEGGRYLEIGVWKGSTLISALYHNSEMIDLAIAVDNWSQFNGPKSKFHHNVRRFLGKNSGVTFYEVDCFSIDPTEITSLPINIYFYDGDHRMIDQEMAFTYYDAIFADLFVAVVDDWCWTDVQKGTARAFEKLGYEVLFFEELFDGWHNGLLVTVLKKPSFR